MSVRFFYSRALLAAYLTGVRKHMRFHGHAANQR